MPVHYEEYTEAALFRSIRNHKKRIAEHKDKITHPAKYVHDWHIRTIEYRQGAIKHWLAEIKNFEFQISQAQKELP